MSRTVVLVTGGGRGLGLDIARDLAARGLRVFTGVRDVDATPSRPGLEKVRLDVTDPESVAAAVRTVRGAEGRLDVLINNAGYGQYGSIEDVDDATARRQFDVNVFGVATMTRAVLPLMRDQGAGRVVTISSVAGRMSTPFAGWYAASKFAVEALHDALRLEVAPFGIRVSLVEPAAVRSGFDEIALDELARTSGSGPYRQAAAAFGEAVRANYRRAADPDVVTAAVREAVQSRNPKARYVVPRVSAAAFVLARRTLSDRAMDALLRSQLGPRRGASPDPTRENVAPE